MLLLASLFALAGAPAPIVIQSGPVAIVRLADLDLASPAGQRVLKHRLAGAIEEVCGSYANVTDWAEIDGVTQCRASATRSAERQLAEKAGEVRLALAR